MEDIKWLCKHCTESMNDIELFDYLAETCTADQIERIVGHIQLLEENMMIGYDKKDVFVLIMDDDETSDVLKISKK